MASLTSYNKTELIGLVEQYRKQVDDLNAANEILSAAADGDDAAAPAAADIPSDMMMTGFLRAVTQVTRKKDNSVVDGLYKFAVETSVPYTDGQDADGAYIWKRVSNYKTVWFTADQALADQLQGLLDTNEWTLVRNWYRYATSARNIIDVQQRDHKTNEVRRDEHGKPLMRKALNHPADLKGQRVDVISSAPKSAADDNDVC